MTTTRDDRRTQKRAGSSERDAKHRAGGIGVHLAIPTGVELFQPEAKTYKLDFSLYTVGKHNPYCRDVGSLYYELTYWAHFGVGPNNDPYCCPSKMRRNPCPICEYRAKIEQKGPPDGTDRKTWWRSEVSPFQPKERQLWLPHVRGQDDEKVLLWDFSHFNFGKLLDQMRQAASEEDVYKTDFDDPQAGAYLVVTFSSEKMESYSYLKAINIEFVSRPKGMNPALLQHNIDLESIPILCSYEDIKKAFYQIETPDDKDEQTTGNGRGRSRARPADKEEDWEGPAEPTAQSQATATKTTAAQNIVIGSRVRHRKLGVCVVLKVSGDGTSLVLEDEKEEIHRAIDSMDVRLVAVDSKPEMSKDDWTEDAADPTKSAGAAQAKPREEKTAARTAKTSPSDDWDDTPQQTPTAKPTAKAKSEDDWDD